LDSSIVIAVLALLTVFWGVGAYQRFGRERVQCRQAFEPVPAHLKRRHALVPALVETARAHLRQDREMLESLIVAVNRAVSANTAATRNPLDAKVVKRLNEAEGALNAELDRLLAAMDRTPALKADRNMARLAEELGAAEHKIDVAREVYNNAAGHYNGARSQFPGILIAVIFSFHPVVLLVEHAAWRKA
jgi:LemA protein